MTYDKTDDYKYFEKLAELEKFIEAEVKQGKVTSGVNSITTVFSRAIKDRQENRLKISLLNDTIDDGIDEFGGHVKLHGLVLRPDEALYHAIGRKDPEIYDAIRGISISDILSMITNKAMVYSHTCGAPMRIATNDVPVHIEKIAMARSSRVDRVMEQNKNLPKVAKDLDVMYDVTVKDGKKFQLGGKFVESDRSRFKELISDGVIIKMIKIYSDGRKENVIRKAGGGLAKKASFLNSADLFSATLEYAQKR